MDSCTNVWIPSIFKVELNIMNNHLSYKMEGDKSTNYNDEYYKNVKLVGFVKTDCETLPGYKNDAFQWSSSDNLSNYPPVYHNENNLVPSKYYHIHKKKIAS